MRSLCNSRGMQPLSFCVSVPFRVACGWVASMGTTWYHICQGGQAEETYFWSRAWGDCAVQSVKKGLQQTSAAVLVPYF